MTLINHPPTSEQPEKVAYRKPQPWGMVPDMVVPDALGELDDRLWAPIGPDAWSRPLHLNPTAGFYTHVLKVQRAGVFARHRHSGQVHAYVFKGAGTTSNTTGSPKPEVMFSNRQARPTHCASLMAVRK